MVIIIGDNNCNDYVMVMIIVIIMHVMVFRLVTCSCHGKGPSDSEGGVEKKNLRHCEFKRQIELNSTEDAYNQNKRDLDKVAIFLTTPKPKLLSIASFFSKKKHDPKLPPVLTPEEEHKSKVADFFKNKKRHTICSRTHHLVKSGLVDHLIRPDINACTNINSHFCFCPEMSGSAGGPSPLALVPSTTAMTERSCYECAGCFVFDKANCKLGLYTGKPERRQFELARSNGTGLVANRIRREGALLSRMKAKVKAGVNVVVCISEGDGKYTWRIAKALGKPRGARAGEKDHDGAAIGKSLVVDVHQYGILKPDGTEFSDYDAAVGAFENDPQSVAFCLRTPAGECANSWSNCGINAGCKKQHKLTYRLAGLREPAGFRMATPRRGKVRAARKQGNQAPLLYLPSTGVLQQIWQNLGALDVA
jgi:hypothetical protein